MAQERWQSRRRDDLAKCPGREGFSDASAAARPGRGRDRTLDDFAAVRVRAAEAFNSGCTVGETAGEKLPRRLAF